MIAVTTRSLISVKPFLRILIPTIQKMLKFLTNYLQIVDNTRHAFQISTNNNQYIQRVICCQRKNDLNNNLLEFSAVPVYVA